MAMGRFPVHLSALGVSVPASDLVDLLRGHDPCLWLGGLVPSRSAPATARVGLEQYAAGDQPTWILAPSRLLVLNSTEVPEKASGKEEHVCLIEELSKKPLTAEKKDRLCRPEILLPIDTITSRIFRSPSAIIQFPNQLFVLQTPSFAFGPPVFSSFLLPPGQLG